MNVVLDPRITKRSHQNSVEVATEHGKAVHRHRGLVAQVAVGTPVEIDETHVSARGLNHLYRLGYDLLAYPVSRNDRDALLFRLLGLPFRVHGRKLNTIAIIELPVWVIRHFRLRAKN